MKKPWPRALILGIVASVFFSFTYILNSSIAQSGGIWLLGDTVPGIAGWLGLILILGGMIINSLLTIKNK